MRQPRRTHSCVLGRIFPDLRSPLRPTQRKDTEVRWHLELEMKGRCPSPASPSNSSQSLSLFPALSLREDPVRNGEAQSQAH